MSLAISTISCWFTKSKRPFYIDAAQTGGSLVGNILTKDKLKKLRHLTNEPADSRAFGIKTESSIDINYFKDKQSMVLTNALFMNEFAVLIDLTYLGFYAVVYGASTSESNMMLTILNDADTFDKFVPANFAQIYRSFKMMIFMSVSINLLCFIIWSI